MRKNRTIYRAKHIPLDELYTRGELIDLEKEFASAVKEGEVISKLDVEVILHNMGITVEQSELNNHIGILKPDFKEESIDYELFVRIVALTLELKNFGEKEMMLQEGYEEDVNEEYHWYNQDQK